MKFKELSEAEWEFIKPYLSEPALTADHEQTIEKRLMTFATSRLWAFNGLIRHTRAYGAPVTAWRRFKN